MRCAPLWVDRRHAGWQPKPAAAGEMLVRGSFPELWADPAIPAREFYQSYVSTYLERDLRQIVNVGSLRDFERFLRACAVRAGQLLNKSGIGIPRLPWVNGCRPSRRATR